MVFCERIVAYAFEIHIVFSISIIFHCKKNVCSFAYFLSFIKSYELYLFHVGGVTLVFFNTNPHELHMGQNSEVRERPTTKGNYITLTMTILSSYIFNLKEETTLNC